MGRVTRPNPLGFTHWPVTFVTIVTYIALLGGLLSVHHSVPAPPAQNHLPTTIDLHEAWNDLQHLASGFRPYNSLSNDDVRSWLLSRIYKILKEQDVKFEVFGEKSSAPKTAAGKRVVGQILSKNSIDSSRVLIFDDLNSNATFSSSKTSRESVYFEGTNIIVYVRGSEDPPVSTWYSNESRDDPSPPDKRGVLVNAHYDSVSTGYGATDDGVGVITILQLIKHYTSSKRQPKRGLVALLNNGEEDYLNGARAFAQHPASKFPDTFLNLEGAGAGGRATLFRSTDAEVTRSYASSPYPFGTAVSADGFKQGLVRSGTDYSIFADNIGLRGLDVAFLQPRSMYHTVEDSSRRTNKNSLWHMLSAAVATTKQLTSDTDTEYASSERSQAVYFDLFGRAFAILPLQVLFALSVVLLVIGPPLLIITAIILYRANKWYVFASRVTSDSLAPYTPDEPTDVSIGGWHGFFRFLIAFVSASAGVAALAALLINVNQYVLYSSPYAVWSTFLSAWFVIAWTILNGTDYIRPSAFYRTHAIGWLYAISWVLLLAATVAEARLKIAGAYPMVFFNVSVLLALLVSYAGFAALPKRSDYALSTARDTDFDGHEESAHRPSDSSPRRSSDTEANETTTLLNHDPPVHRKHHQGRIISSLNFTWPLEFILLFPFNLILFTQNSLFLTSALSQTPADGSSVPPIYYAMVFLSIMPLALLSPFMHRISGKIPALLVFVLVGTLVYNLTAFPFSDRARLKVFFQQRLDLDTGMNNVTLTGIDEYLQRIVEALPSATGEEVDCTKDPHLVIRPGLTTCSWQGLAPHPVRFLPHQYNNTRAPYTNATTPHEPPLSSWLNLTTSVSADTTSTAVFRMGGLNTRACKLSFSRPLSDYNVTGAGPHDSRFIKIPDAGAYELRLWSRTWGRTWEVSVRFAENQEVDQEDTGDDDSFGSRSSELEGHETKRKNLRTNVEGQATCLYSDANDAAHTIPALEEVWRYAPVWSGVSKAGDGLFEVFKNFEIVLET